MIERTFDFRRVKRMAPEWRICISPECYYLIAVVDGDDVGAFYYHPFSDGTECHVNFIRGFRGKQCLDEYRKAIVWMADNTNCETLYGNIPTGNRGAIAMARNSGLDFCHVDEDGFRLYSIELNSIGEKHREVL